MPASAARYFDRLDRLRLLGGLTNIRYLVDGPRVEQCHANFGTERFLELHGWRIWLIRHALGDDKHTIWKVACLIAVGPPVPPA